MPQQQYCGTMGATTMSGRSDPNIAAELTLLEIIVVESAGPDKKPPEVADIQKWMSIYLFLCSMQDPEKKKKMCVLNAPSFFKFKNLLFAYIYTQLWLVIKYDYKRWCFRTYVLYVSLVWCALRVTLFSYYAMLEHQAAKGHNYATYPSVLSRRVGIITYFLLYSFPLYLQFCCLCLMVAYFYQIHRSSRNNFHPSELSEWRWPLTVLVLLNLLVLLVNFASSVVIKLQEGNDSWPLPSSMASVSFLHSSSLPLLTVAVVQIRVLVNGLTFMTLCAALAYVTVQVAQTSEARLLLETEHLTQRSAVLVCVLLVFLYLCRTVINILALIPAVSFVLDTDQVDLLSDSRSAYFMFVSVLFLWEFVPTLLVVVFFRVKNPRVTLTMSPYPPHAPAGVDYLNTSSQLLSDSLSEGSTDGRIASFYNPQHSSYSPRYYSNGLYSSGGSYGDVSFQYAGVNASGNVMSDTLVNQSQTHQGGGGSSGHHLTLGSAALPTLSYSGSVPQNLYYLGEQDFHDAQPAAAALTATQHGDGANVHSLSTRFIHRTSLFSYRILNRASGGHGML